MKTNHSDPEDEIDNEGSYLMEEFAQQREELMQELTSDNDDYARSHEDGWYYSDDC